MFGKIVNLHRALFVFSATIIMVAALYVGAGTVGLLDSDQNSAHAQSADVQAWVTDRMNQSGLLEREYPQVDGQLTVFLSLSDGSSASSVAMGSGQDVQSAFAAALTQLAHMWNDSRGPQWLKFDVVTSIEHAPGIDVKGIIPMTRSLQGLAINWDAGLAFLPEELVSYTLVDSDSELRLGNIRDYVDQRYAFQQPLEALENAATVKLEFFQTESYFVEAEAALPLYRGHRMIDNVTAEQMVEAAIQGGEYLTAAVYPDGRFVYAYLPKSDSESDNYNMVRHAGTLYAMAELYGHTQDPALLDAIQRAINYMLLTTVYCPGQTSGELFLCVVENDAVKLGGNALAVVALAEYTRNTGDDQYMDVIYGLAGWIEDALLEDGSFVEKVFVSTNEIDPIDSIYYPGEAILAMTRLHQVDGDGRWLDVAESAAQYLILVRDASKATEDLPHDHWLLYGMNDLYRERPEDLYMDHAMRITQAITDRQNVDPIYDDWFGSFNQPPRSTPTATRSEGLCAAYQLARDYDRPDDAERIMTTIQNAIRFQLQTQFQPESVMYLADPQRALGGFHRSLTNFEIRNDYVQHNVSALLCTARLLGE